MSDIRYKVYTYCATYNHSKYIKDTLNGFCMQKTDFPFVCAIKDDASTDGEPEIIRQYLEDNFDFTDSSVAYKKETEYGHVFFAQHKDNKNCYFAVVLLKENHYSQKKDVRPYFQEWREGVPYIALCEGDDYWTDSHKLQKQVEYMDKHPECTLCFTKAKVLSDDESLTHLYDCLEERNYDGNDMLNKWIVPTNTAICRSSILCEKPVDTRFYFGDIVLWLTCASKGECHCLDICSGVYRRCPAGMVLSEVKNKLLFLNRKENHLRALLDHFPQYRKSIKSALISIAIAKTNMYVGGFASACIIFIRYAREYGIRYIVRFLKSLFK